MQEVQKILDAVVQNICRQEGLDPDLATIENRVGHVHVHVERPDLPKWPVAMSPGLEHLARDCPMQIEEIERTLRTLAEAHLALKHVHDHFDGTPPLWATGIHPMTQLAIGRSSYTLHEMLKSSRSGTWRPDKSEEFLLGDKSGLHLEMKMIRLEGGRLFRARGTFSTIDVSRVPDTVRTAVTGRKLADFMETPGAVGDLKIHKATDRPDIGVTRLEIWADLIPMEAPPPGENPWWIAKWSAWQNMRMERVS